MRRRRIAAGFVIVSVIMAQFSACLIPVFALSVGGLNTTIASVILSLMLQCGVAPTNATWLQTLNTSYGVESSIGTISDCIGSGLLTETAGGLVDSGLSAAIESAPAYAELGLSDVFSTVATDAGVTVASGGTNLATTAINVGTLGKIGAFAGAAGVGIGIGVLANHLYNRYQQSIASNIPYNIQLCPDLAYLPYHNYVAYQSSDWQRPTYTYDQASENRMIFVKGGGITYNVNLSNEEITYYRTYKKSNSSNWNNITSGTVPTDQYVKHSYGYVAAGATIYSSADVAFSTSEEALEYIDGLLSGSIEPPVRRSDDFVGPEGNCYVNPETGQVPGLADVVPPGYDMYPVDYDNYIDAANDWRTNTENGDDAINGDVFDNLVDPLLIEPSIIPDQGVVMPDYGSQDIVPGQPTFPEKPTVTPENVEVVLSGTATPQLRSIFPFCIPFDLYEIVSVFKTDERKAPHIVFVFPLNEDWVIDVDLSVYDDVAALLRTLELLAFIVGLAVATRYLIGATG